jgi:hypothetical protein
MSYTISVSGHGLDAEAARQAFTDLIAALDEATGDAGSKASGQLSGTETNDSGVSVAFLVRAEDVRGGEEPASDANATSTEEPAGLAPVVDNTAGRTVDTETAILEAQAAEATVPAEGDTPEPSSGNAASDTPAEGSVER